VRDRARAELARHAGDGLGLHHALGADAQRIELAAPHVPHDEEPKHLLEVLLAGIDLDMSRATDERILLHPAIVGTIERASASFQSRLGLIRSSWSRKGDRLHLELTVPAGATATATLPSGKAAAIRVNDAPLTSSAKLREIHATGTQVSLVLAGGTYQFDMPFAALAQ